MSNKYQPLADYLSALSVPEVRMTFADVEHVLGGKLPPVAYSSPAFWANSKTADSHGWAHLWQVHG
jgi:putative restriction endonuclease